MKNLQFGETADKKMTWQEANDWIKELNKSKYLGFTDWRLPTIKELTSCIDYSKHNPASDMDFKSDYYWSSTTIVLNTGFAWFVGFYNGYVNGYNKTASHYVRPVLGGQCVGNLKIKKSDIKREARY